MCATVTFAGTIVPAGDAGAFLEVMRVAGDAAPENFVEVKATPFAASRGVHTQLPLLETYKSPGLHNK